MSAAPISVAGFAALGITLPLRVDPAYPGTIVDANDRDVCVVDHNGERADEQVQEIVALLLSACNGEAIVKAARDISDLPHPFTTEEALTFLSWEGTRHQLADELARAGYRKSYRRRLYHAAFEHVWLPKTER